ncbi:hypothetical protein AYI70_g5253 [Smittium culicis]|uniref:Uncharacterized protein n=1 Tax=Smittium culicis TaxID=133412 RepID=A0A1R1XVD5_9FUNG|nr:hypothetical protein AYI70_g5253 [Smittium culicis]
MHGPHDVGLFASRVYKKVEQYYSWFIDNQALAPKEKRAGRTKKKPKYVERISRYTRSISDLIRRGAGTSNPKGRAIGATLESNSAVSADEIVPHTFWSNYSMFDT